MQTVNKMDAKHPATGGGALGSVKDWTRVFDLSVMMRPSQAAYTINHRSLFINVLNGLLRRIRRFSFLCRDIELDPGFFWNRRRGFAF